MIDKVVNSLPIVSFIFTECNNESSVIQISTTSVREIGCHLRDELIPSELCKGKSK